MYFDHIHVIPSIVIQYRWKLCCSYMTTAGVPPLIIIKTSSLHSSLINCHGAIMLFKDCDLDLCAYQKSQRLTSWARDKNDDRACIERSILNLKCNAASHGLY